MALHNGRSINGQQGSCVVDQSFQKFRLVNCEFQLSCAKIIALIAAEMDMSNVALLEDGFNVYTNNYMKEN